jgi:hypothetical protein
MAINLQTEFTPRIDPPSPSYPTGAIKDSTTPTSNDGTPLRAIWGNDWQGFSDALLAASGITASGLADTALLSQRFDAVQSLVLQQNLKATAHNAKAGERVVADNSAGSATINLPASPIDGNTVEVSGIVKYSVNPVIVDGNGKDIMIAADSTCTLNIDDVVFGFRFNATDDLWKIYKVALEGEVI